MATTANTEKNVPSTPSAAPAGKKGGLFPKILLALAAVVAAFIIVVAMQPKEFRVARTATIAAPPEVVFEQVNSFHNWQNWSPWAKLDPAAKNSFEGPESGAGAIFHWSGNNDVGEGTTTITESRPNELVRMKLEFVRPFAGTNDVEFSLKPVDEGTSITWGMTGDKNFIAKAMGLFMDCEKMCGDQFNQGLSNLNALVTSAPQQP